MARLLVTLAFFGLLGCGGATKPDGIPPGAVSDLVVANVADTSVTLTWTAPGDDGTRGRATAYDLRFGRFSVLTYWDIGTLAPTSAPGPAGGTDSVVVSGLVQDASYNFAIRTVDEAGNWSGLSNMASGVPADQVPPATITDLAAETLDHRRIRLTWTAPGDDGSQGLVEGYDIRFDTSPLTGLAWNTYPQAVFTQSPVVGGERQFFVLSGLETTTTYYAAVRAYDEAENVAGISNIVMASTPQDTIPPGAVTDLSARLVTPVAVALSWTAPGDDGMEGQATFYDVRYAQVPITESTWNTAIRASATQGPQAGGAPETLTVAPLEGRTILYFALKTADEVGNTSPLSNVYQIETAQTRVWRILIDESGDAPTIQAGIDSAAMNDTVLVEPGTYFVNLHILGKDVTLLSTRGPNLTVLDGSKGYDSVLFLGNCTRGMLVEGFTMTGGIGHPRDAVTDGGAIYLSGGSSPVVQGNRFVANGAIGTTFYGGAIVAWGGDACSPLIQDNYFEGNEARLGGAMAIGRGSPEINNNTFRSNVCLLDGGAIYASINPGRWTVLNNEFWNNQAGDHGGALQFSGTSSGRIVVSWNLFVANVASGQGSGDTGSGGALVVSDVTGVISNNTIVDGVGLTETGCGGGGLSLEYTSSDLEVVANIFAFNKSCAVACHFEIANQLGRNLFWMNEGGDLGSGNGRCPLEWAVGQLFADPLFCNPEAYDYTLASDSPALTGSEQMGAFPTPGCEPGAATRGLDWGLSAPRYR